jgi:hypothetical protein
VRERAEIVNRVLAERFAAILPQAMRAAGIEMWIVACHEDDLDPVFRTMIAWRKWSA